MRVADDIVTIAELKNDAATVVKQLRETRRPMIVTQRGKAAMVLLAPEEYDRLVYAQEIVVGLNEAMAEADAGLLTPHESVMGQVRDDVERHVPEVATARRARENSPA